MQYYKRMGILFVFGIHYFIGAQNPKVVFCTFFTPSHENLAKKWMIPSLQDNVPMILGTSDQKCSSATFFEHNWTATMRDKVNFIVNVINENKNNIVVFVDPDIVFFRPVKERIIELLANIDFVGQRDKAHNPEICTGFIAMKVNKAMLAFWKKVQSLMKKDSSLCDQGAFNKVLRTYGKKHHIRWAFLPPDEFFGGGTFAENQWKPGKDFHIPDNPRMFHANFTKFPHKEAMLQHVLHTLASAQQ